MGRLRIVRGTLLLVLGGVALFSCVKDDIAGDEKVTGANGDISFEIGFAPQMRVSTAADFTAAWEDGDEIGVFAVTHGTSLSETASANYINNVKLTYDGTSWTQATPLYWPGGGAELDFYAYYPYDASATDPTAITFNVKADQSGMTDGKPNYHLSDLLTAKSDNSGDGWAKGSTVNLTFKHALAMVQMTIDDRVGALNISKTTVKLRGVKTGSILNLGDLSAPTVALATDNNDALDITMHRVADGDGPVFRALVPAQTLAENTNIFRIVGDEILLDGSKLTAAVTMTAGQAETFTQNTPYTALPLIPAGTFKMGSSDGSNRANGTPEDVNYDQNDLQAYLNEKPQHWVRLTEDFYLSKYLITNAQYATFLNAIGVGNEGKFTYSDSYTALYPATELVQDCSIDTHSQWGVKWDNNNGIWVPMTGYENHPVIYVTWYGAAEYAHWVGGRLPTEAEWEYASRAGTTTIYSFGDDAANLGDYAWYSENSGPIGEPDYGTKAVGQKFSNLWGLYDMGGNVLEWCLDQWDLSNNYPTAATEAEAVSNPLIATGPYRVLRGGSCISSARECRVAYRNLLTPLVANHDVGFRVAFEK